MRTLARVVGVLVGIIGIVVIAHTWLTFSKNVHCSASATALVTEKAVSDDQEPKPSYIIQWEANGKTVSESYTFIGSEQEYSIGDAVYIRYNPSDPSKYLMEGTPNLDFQNAMYMLLGAYLIIGGFLLLLQRKTD